MHYPTPEKLEIKTNCAMIAQADNSNRFRGFLFRGFVVSYFMVSYFITVKHKQGSKKLFLAEHNTTRRDDKLDRGSK